MRKVCGFRFYGIRDILKSAGYLCPASLLSLRRYMVRFSREGEESVISELKCAVMLENVDKRRAWVYEVDDKAFLIIYEAKPFKNHAQHQIVVEKCDAAFVFPIKLGVVKLFENQVLTIENAERVSLFIGRLLNKDWFIRFLSDAQVKAGY